MPNVPVVFHPFCIVCPKAEELRQLISILDQDRRFRRVWPGRTNPTDVVYQVGPSENTVKVTTCGSMGDTSAAVRTAQMITRYQPGVLILLGTAASLKPESIQIGDVVIPKKSVSRIYEKVSERGQPDYHARAALPNFKEYLFDDTNALISDMSTMDCSAEAQTAVASLRFDENSLECGDAPSLVLGGEEIGLRNPKIHYDVDIFSCGMVVDSVSYRKFIIETASAHMRNVAVLDMESHGFFKALDAANRLDFGHQCSGIIIRGISDYAGRKAQTEARPEGWKEKSVRNASLVAAALIDQLARNAVSIDHQPPTSAVSA